MLMLSMAVMVLAWRLHDRQKEVRQLGAALETARKGRAVPCRSQLSGCRKTRWSRTDRRSKSRHSFPSRITWAAPCAGWPLTATRWRSACPAPRQARPAKRILRDRSLSSRFSTSSGKATIRLGTLSNPQFVLLPGEEASVRLAGRDGDSRDLFRYRVKAEKEKNGQISARIAFDCEVPDAAEQRPVIDSPINAEVMVKEGTPVLLGASGDATRRHELYMWAGTRSIAANGRPSTGKGNHL